MTQPTRSQIDAMRALPAAIKAANNAQRCTCLTCWPRDFLDESSQFFRACPTCGNKRCPKTTNHRHACTNSNEPGQAGSVYGTPSPLVGADGETTRGDTQHG